MALAFYPVSFGLYVGQDSFLLFAFIALAYHNSAPLQVGEHKSSLNALFTVYDRTRIDKWLV